MTKEQLKQEAEALARQFVPLSELNEKSVLLFMVDVLAGNLAERWVDEKTDQAPIQG